MLILARYFGQLAPLVIVSSYELCFINMKDVLATRKLKWDTGTKVNKVLGQNGTAGF